MNKNKVNKMNKNKLGDIEGNFNAANVPVQIEEVKTSKLPSLKSATAAAAITGILALLPTIAMFFPQISPFVGAINAVAKVFGYGAL